MTTEITPEMIRAAQDHDLATRPARGNWGAVSAEQVTRLLTGAFREMLAELADVRERADFYEADRDRERLAAEHHRTACVELEAELTEARAGLAAERERIRAEIDALNVTFWRPGNGPGLQQPLDVVPSMDLLKVLEGGAPS